MIKMIKYELKKHVNLEESLAIKELLMLADKEFVPPLSLRHSSSQLNFNNKQKTENIENYLNDILKQENILVIDDEKDKIVGFLSFKFDYILNFDDERKFGLEKNNIYISTIIVNKKYRGRGITYSMYKLLLSKFPQKYLYTRTWSGNNSHIFILNKLDFSELYRAENDRIETLLNGKQKNHDTIYYQKKPRVKGFN